MQLLSGELVGKIIEPIGVDGFPVSAEQLRLPPLGAQERPELLGLLFLLQLVDLTCTVGSRHVQAQETLRKPAEQKHDANKDKDKDKDKTSGRNRQRAGVTSGAAIKAPGAGKGAAPCGCAAASRRARARAISAPAPVTSSTHLPMRSSTRCRKGRETWVREACVG
jgi:hypothetical protein